MLVALDPFSGFNMFQCVRLRHFLTFLFVVTSELAQDKKNSLKNTIWTSFESEANKKEMTDKKENRAEVLLLRYCFALGCGHSLLSTASCLLYCSLIIPVLPTIYKSALGRLFAVLFCPLTFNMSCVYHIFLIICRRNFSCQFLILWISVRNVFSFF